MCFSGIGGITRVGCRLTSVCLNEANSEYRRRTSKSYATESQVSQRKLLAYLTFIVATHARTNGINNVSTASFMVLASIRDQYRHFGILVEYLLDAAVVDALLAAGWLRLANFKIVIVLIFGISQARYIVWWLGRDG